MSLLAHEKRRSQIQHFLDEQAQKIESEWELLAERHNIDSERFIEFRLGFYIHLLLRYYAQLANEIEFVCNTSAIVANDARFKALPAELFKSIDDFSNTTEEAMALKSRLGSRINDSINFGLESAYQTQETLDPEKVFFGKGAMDEVSFDPE